MTHFLSLTVTATSNAVSTAGTQISNADYTVLFSILGLLVCIGFPTAAILLGILKYDGSFKQTLWGIIGYIVFTMMLYSIVSTICLSGYSDQEATDFQAGILIVIRVICEALGMFCMLKFTRKRRGLGNALTFGSAYCIMECFMVGLLLVTYMIVITSEGVDSISSMRELRIYVQDKNLVAGEEWKFIMKAFTALVFCCLEMSQVLVMFVGIQLKKYWLGIVSILFGLLVRLPNRLHAFDSWFWGNYAVIIPYLAVVTVIICVVTYVIWKNNKEEMLALPKNETIIEGGFSFWFRKTKE